MDVLDKGFVTLLDHMGDDKMISNCARVSFNKYKEEFDESDENLIKYLAEHNHWTPFSHPQIQFRIKAPIYVRTQLFKSKVGLTENEVSRRYVDDEPEFYIPDPFRGRPEGSMKQGSTEGSVDHSFLCAAVYEKCLADSARAYSILMTYNVAPEQSRGILPQCTYTTWIWTGSLAAFARVVNLREYSHAQWETQQYAQAIRTHLEGLFPVAMRYL